MLRLHARAALLCVCFLLIFEKIALFDCIMFLIFELLVYVYNNIILLHSKNTTIQKVHTRNTN